MKTEVSLGLKLLVLSAILSVAIKYLAPLLHVPVTSTNALIGVFLPPAVVMVALLWRNFGATKR